MANTTNFGWETPDDTDLVKDGAAAIRTLGSAIDTSLLDLKGGTTDQVLAKNSNTDMDFKWVAQDDSNAIQNAIVDAKGDLISATAADTPARLAVGANGTVLSADSAETTGLKWITPSSGGMTLLNGPSGTTFTGSTLTINITPTGYTSLKIYLKGVYATADATMQLRFNGDTGSNYSYVTVRSGPSQVSSASSTSIFYMTQGSVTTGTDAKVLTYVVLDIFDPNATDSVQVHHSSMNGPSGDMRYTFGVGAYDCSAAITSISFIANSGNFSGGTAYVYGVK